MTAFFIINIDSKGNYSANRLDIDYANSKNKEEIIKSYGSVPFDLNLGSKNFGLFFEKSDSLDFHAKIKSKIDAFFKYIPELDSVRGAVDIALSLTGPSSAIVRNGSIDVNNSSVYTMLINNPLVNVDGSAVMSNNQLKINYLNGTSIEQNIK